MPAEQREPEGQSPPRILGSWRNAYLLVLGTLAFFIAAFSAISFVYR